MSDDMTPDVPGPARREPAEGNPDVPPREAAGHGSDVHAGHADRPPTPDEEREAERSAREVDLDSVGTHYEEMTEIGKNVKGEGEIVPDR